MENVIPFEQAVYLFAQIYRDDKLDKIVSRFDEEPEEWITVRGNHIPLDEGKNPVGGQLKAFGGNARVSINGTNISSSFKRRPEKFKFAIQDVMDAQGFDGLPKVVDDKEFQEAVKKSGFIAQRVYSADTQELLDAYRDQLYNGEWYVDCSEGGAQYGRGMYSVANYKGELTDDIKAEIETYIAVGDNKVQKDEWIKRAEIAIKGNTDFDDDKLRLALEWADAYYDRDHKKSAELMEKLSDDEREEINDLLQSEVSENEYKPHYIETFTLEPDAKILTHKDLINLKYGANSDEWDKCMELVGKDDGAVAAMLGYDAIRIGNGYTVVLNRTKVIFKQDDSHNDSKDGQIYFQYDDDGNLWAIKGQKVIGLVCSLSASPKDDERRDSDDEPDWITVNGAHIPINDNGTAVGGWAKGKDFSEAKSEGSDNDKKESHSEKLLHPSKHKINQQIAEVVSAAVDGGYAEDAIKVADILDTLEPGSVITIPDGEWKGKFIKNAFENRWITPDKEQWTSETIAWFFFNEDKEKAYVSKSAMSDQEKIMKAESEAQNSFKNNWRNKGNAWEDDKDFSEQQEIKLSKDDYSHAGIGMTVTGKDGNTYTYYGDGYWKCNEEDKNVKASDIAGGKFSGDYFDVSFGMNGMSKESVEELRKTVASMPENVRSKYEEAFRQHQVVFSEGGSYYNELSGKVNIEKDENTAVAIHEMSHALDKGSIDIVYQEEYFNGKTYDYHVTSASKNLDYLVEYGSKAHKEDFESMAKLVGIKTNGDGWFADEDEQQSCIKSYMLFSSKHSQIPGYDCVSDAISALTLDACKGSLVYGGHDSSYWMRGYGGEASSANSCEYWANFCELKAMGYNEALDLLKQITPNKYAAAEATYKEVFRGKDK